MPSPPVQMREGDDVADHVRTICAGLQTKKLQKLVKPFLRPELEPEAELGPALGELPEGTTMGARGAVAPCDPPSLES